MSAVVVQAAELAGKNLLHAGVDLFFPRGQIYFPESLY